jgi:type III secretion system YscQ/HrcQ family protein
MSETASYDQWIEKIEHILTQAKRLPIAQESFPFPWEEAGVKISACLGLKDLKLIPQSSEWRSKADHLSGMGSPPAVIGIEFSPIGQSIFWVISHEGMGDVTSAALSSDQQKEKFSDPGLQEGYYHFIMLEVLNVISSLKIFRDLSPQLIFSPSLPQEESLCIDVALSFYPKTIYGRVVIPRSFLNAFKMHQPLAKQSLLRRDAVKHLEFTLRLETGSVVLDTEDWKSASPGDYMILDKCSYDPQEKKGSILMYLEGTPILQARIKPEGVKVLDYIFYSDEKPEPKITKATPKPLPIQESLNTEGLIENAEEEKIWEDSSQEELIDEIITNQPLKIDIEADHIRMSLEKILELKPGYMLDIVVRPELGVNMLINNQHVGKGELIKLGDTLGVRISHKTDLLPH